MIKQHEKGFSLVELIFVIAVIALMASIWVSRSFKGDEAGGAEMLLGKVSSRLAERRGDAARLGGLKTVRQAGIANVRQDVLKNPPVLIDLGDLETTASLITDSRDLNNDGRDDSTGLEYTKLKIRQTRDLLGIRQEYDWSYFYRDNPLELPSGWKLARNQAELPVPKIAEGIHGMGELITRIAFAADGKAYVAYRNVWRNQSPFADSSETDEAPFWAFYFYTPDQTPAAAVAVAVHPSGLVETFRWNGSAWHGFANRAITGGTSAPSSSP